MNHSPFPAFTAETAAMQVRLAEDGWNTRTPSVVAATCAIDATWRDRASFLQGRESIVSFLLRKWCVEFEYRLVAELWAFQDNRISSRFAYEWKDEDGEWFRSYGNESCEFDEFGLVRRRFSSINDLPIKEIERKLIWPTGRRPDNHFSMSDLDL